MPAYDLDKRLRALLIRMVAASKEADTNQFSDRPQADRKVEGITFSEATDVFVECDHADIVKMRDLGVVDLSTFNSMQMLGSIRRAALDAVEAGFPPPVASSFHPTYSVVNHNHGQLQQAVGPNAQQAWTSGSSADAVVQLRALLGDLVAAVATVAPVEDATRLQADADAIIAEAGRPDADPAEISGKTGGLVSRALLLIGRGAKATTEAAKLTVAGATLGPVVVGIGHVLIHLLRGL